MEPIVKTIVPLLSWTLQKTSGPLFKPSEWRAVALSMVPPSDSLVRVIKWECGDLDTPALLSPSERRRVRKGYKRYLRNQFRGNPFTQAVCQFLLHYRRELETAGYTSDVTRIGKLRDIEAETNEHFCHVAESTEWQELVGPVSQERAHDAASLAWEFAVYGEGGNKPKLRRSSAVWNIFGLNPGQLKTMPPEEGLILCLCHFMALFGLRGQQPEEHNQLRLLRWVVKTHLPSDREPETTPEALNKATIADLIHRGIKVIDEESQEVVQMDVEDKSAAQPEDMCDLDDSDRLLRFSELVGIDINEFTPGERERMLGLVDFFEKDYEKSSKIGLSYRDYYGDKSDSEKTQRARLFQKIRERASYPYLKD